MRRLISHFSIPFAFALLLSACTLPFLPQKSGLIITSSPPSGVFLNNESFGSTPLMKDGLRSGSYKIKLVPVDPTIPSWEGNITLTSGTKTAVDRQLNTDPNLNGGYVLSYEKLSNSKATEVSIVSAQSNVMVAIDGKQKGFTPVTDDSLEPKSHVFFLTSPGFQDRSIKGLISPGLRLVINAQLAGLAIVPTPTPEPTPAPTATPSGTLTPTPRLDPLLLPKQSSPSAITKPFVEILPTPTGWLKVRAAGNSSGTELAKVNPGDRFPYLDVNTAGWFQIEYLPGKNGWISATYAKLVK